MGVFYVFEIVQMVPNLVKKEMEILRVNSLSEKANEQ